MLKKISFSFFLFLFAFKFVAAQPGALDPSFGNGGILQLHPNFTVDQARDIALTTDGKILMLSVNYNIGNWLIKLNADGTLDTTFGFKGKLHFLQGEPISATAIEVDSANRILVFAFDDIYFYEFIGVYRFLPDGQPDLTFGTNGVIVTGFAKANRAMMVQPDGKIIAAGQNGNSIATVKRINVDGTFDTTFNGIGSYSLVNLPYSYVFALHLQQDGKLLATGTTEGKMFIARFNTNGKPDTTFNNIGYKTFEGTGVMAGQSVVTMPDGKILIAGHVESSTESSMLCWRILPNGTLDNSFAIGGIDTLYTGSENNFAWFTYSNQDSTVIVGGSIFNGLVYQPVLYQLLTDGTPDNSFGVNGIAGKTFDCAQSIQINSARTPSGKILYSGTGFKNGSSQLTTSQFFSDGLIDSSFGINGTASHVAVDSVGDYNIIQDFTVLTDGKILCASVNNEAQLIYTRIDSNGTLDSTYGVNGYYIPNQRVATSNNPYCVINANENNVFVAQNYYSDILDFLSIINDEDLVGFNNPVGVIINKMDAMGSPDSSFGIVGILRLNFADQGNDVIHCSDLKLQPDGKLLCAIVRDHDYGFPYGTESHVFLMRLNTNGTIDSTFADNGTQLFIGQGETAQLLITRRSDGKINCHYSYYISRLLPDGSFDSSFADNGNDSIGLGYVQQFLLQSDNRMLCSTGVYYTQGILCFSEDGAIDSSFAVNGYLDLSFLNYGPYIGCQLQPDNKLIACNSTYGGYTTVARFNNNGTTDINFGTSGLATMPIGSFPHIIRMQSDDKILISQSYDGDFFLARLMGGIGTSINEPKNTLSPKIFPNPTADQLNINYPFLLNEPTVVSITDLTGKTIMNKIVKFNNSNVTLSIADLSQGIYLITISTKNNMLTTKFVKQ